MRNLICSEKRSRNSLDLFDAGKVCETQKRHLDVEIKVNWNSFNYYMFIT